MSDPDERDDEEVATEQGDDTEERHFAGHVTDTDMWRGADATPTLRNTAPTVPDLR